MAEKITAASLSPSTAMKLAISEAKKGHGWVSPNPVVGCVILDHQGILLSTGYHKKLGGPHAEVEALQKIKDPHKLKGAHVFVTLEPCSHFGRTPPCAEALARLPLKEVTYGLLDPNPKVSGRGAEILRKAGITCTGWSEILRENTKEIETELNELAEIFLYNQRQQKCFVSLKVASSLDGKIGMRSGESKWITGELARQQSHVLRAQYDAVVIGKNTFLKDDPSLNVRLPGYEKHINSVVILDPKGESLAKIESSKLARVRPLEKIFIATLNDQNISGTKDGGPRVLRIRKTSGEKLDMPDLLAQLWTNEIKSLFVEGGAHSFAGLLAAREFQRLHLFMAPILLGGAHGASWTQYFGGEKMSDLLAFDGTEPTQFGRDFYFSLKPN